jgi:DNA-binding transcriptional ArsR family regulator
MDVTTADDRASSIAAAIGEPARARMLFHLLDGRARTSTELSLVAEVTPSTASVHLRRLEERSLVKVTAQGKHRYYTLAGPSVARVLEALSVVAGTPREAFVPRTPERLRFARTCYDHIAGSLGVALHDRLRDRGWLDAGRGSGRGGVSYRLTPRGESGLAEAGVDVSAAGAARRRFAFGCLDWSERRPHLGGALGAALLDLALRRRWLERDPDDRALTLTTLGRREVQRRLEVALEASSPADSRSRRSSR